jgi:rubredoxin
MRAPSGPLLLFVGLIAVTATASTKLNVLLIVCDDLRPELSSYNHTHMITPHTDKLAKGSLLFERAYTNYAYCCPSRNSFMSGRMPGTTKVFNFINSFRDATVLDRAGVPGTSWTTLPEHFKKNGYWTVGSGKLFHPDLPPRDDSPASWSINFTDPGENVGCGCPASGVPGAPMWCELPEDSRCPDVVVAQTVVRQLHEWRANHSAAPFFAGLGIHKPHLPWGAPKVRLYQALK